MGIITSSENTKLKLSIQVRLNGLSFLIINCDSNELVWYNTKAFPRDHNPVKILADIENLYTTEKALQNSFQEVVLLFSNDLYSLIPEEYFLEEEASQYLKFNTKILKTDVVAHDLLQENQLVNVYIPFTNITNYLFDKYGEFEYKHSISVLIQAVLEKEISLAPSVYLNCYKEYYDLVVIQNNKLLLSNSFNFDTEADFIYYLLFTLEQLKLDPSEINLILSGEISEESENYKIAYTYIKNVSFLKPDLKLQMTGEYNEQFQREAFVLLKSIECE